MKGTERMSMLKLKDLQDKQYALFFHLYDSLTL